MSLNVFLQDISLSYCGKKIFSDINLHLPQGQWVALTGESGVGKTSLLRLIAGIQTSAEQVQGQIYADNGISVCKQIAYMAQTDLLIPWLNVLDNTLLSIKLYDGRINSECKNNAKNLLQSVGLKDVIYHYPHQLSGGMRQRVALVRTLLQNKPIILMDEPFSALDSISRYKMQSLAATLLSGKTVFIITHDPTEAARLAHSIYLMKGSPAKLSKIAEPKGSPPRNISDPEVVKYQAFLISKLINVHESSV